MICAHQTRDRLSAHDKKINIAIFHNLDLQKYYVEIDGPRYPRDGLLINYEQNDHIEQDKDIKLFFKEYIREPILNLFITYPDMKTKHPIEIIDLRYQCDHITPKKIQEYGANPDNARMFLKVIRRREREFISDGNKLIEVEVI